MGGRREREGRWRENKRECGWKKRGRERREGGREGGTEQDVINPPSTKVISFLVRKPAKSWEVESRTQGKPKKSVSLTRSWRRPTVTVERSMMVRGGWFLRGRITSQARVLCVNSRLLSRNGYPYKWMWPS